jgi:hypothetical protein
MHPNRSILETIIRHRVMGRFVMMECVSRSGAVLLRHSHPKIHVTFVVSGRYTETLCGWSELCVPGAVRLLPAGENHAAKFERDSRYLTVEIDPKSFPCIAETATLYSRAGQIQSPLVGDLAQRFYCDVRALDDLWLRIQRACALLRTSGMPLAEIALQCGFADQSHFSATFKRTMGSTPSAWREE